MEAIGLLMLAPLLYSLLIFVLWGCGVSSKPDVSASDKTMNGNLVAFLDDQIAKNGGGDSAYYATRRRQ